MTAIYNENVHSTCKCANCGMDPIEGVMYMDVVKDISICSVCFPKLDEKMKIGLVECKTRKDSDTLFFNHIDSNKDGKISPEEFKSFFADWLGVQESQMKTVFTKVDTNENGSIDFEEFRAFLDSV
mmetsp:Transcript_8964/g.13408  ORF Transcript_8964/g.13408 Transcript_8964/m.13408 type:complete len:126 (+) Transcript_8964:57-434(+)